MKDAQEKIRIVIASDCRLLRECLHLVLEGEEWIKIGGEAANGIQAIDMISEIKPDVVLLSIQLGDVDGIEILPAIKEKSHETKVLLLPGSIDDAALLRALRQGVKGYLPKYTGISGLIAAIKAVHEGEIWIERKLTAKLFKNDDRTDLRKDSGQENIKECLTKREQEILRFLSSGCTNKEIAEALFISEKTVKSHLNSIFRKLNVSRRLQAILYGIKQGIC